MAPRNDIPLFLTALPFGGEKRCREKLIENLDLQKGHRAIDISCGTGTSTTLIKRKVGASGKAVGIDFAEEMIRRAKRKDRRRNTIFICGNSTHIPFQDRSFDRAHISIALHEMDRETRHKTLREIFRVLKDEGKLLIVDYNEPDGFFRRILFNILMSFETEHAMDMINEGLEKELGINGFSVAKRMPILGSLGQVVLAHKVDAP